MSDMVNHPPHYLGHPAGIECIQITEHMSFCLGNALKYIWRSDLKGDAVEDLKKARWYLDREIARREQPSPADRERDLRAAQLRDHGGCDDAPVSVMQRDPGDEDDGSTTAEALWGHLERQPDSARYAGPRDGQGLSVTSYESEG